MTILIGNQGSLLYYPDCFIPKETMNHLHRLDDLKTTADLTIQQWIQQAESGGISD